MRAGDCRRGRPVSAGRSTGIARREAAGNLRVTTHSTARCPPSGMPASCRPCVQATGWQQDTRAVKACWVSDLKAPSSGSCVRRSTRASAAALTPDAAPYRPQHPESFRAWHFLWKPDLTQRQLGRIKGIDEKSRAFHSLVGHRRVAWRQHRLLTPTTHCPLCRQRLYLTPSYPEWSATGYVQVISDG